MIPLESFNLTKKQIRLIRLSLNLQNRSNRPENENCKNFINSWYCHAAVGALVVEDFDKNLLDKSTLLKRVPLIDNFRGTSKPITKVEDLNIYLSVISEPQVGHAYLFSDGRPLIYHSFVFLGIRNNTAWIWEKINKGLPFRLTTIESVFADYPKHNWGFVELASVMKKSSALAPCTQTYKQVVNDTRF